MVLPQIAKNLCIHLGQLRVSWHGRKKITCMKRQGRGAIRLGQAICELRRALSPSRSDTGPEELAETAVADCIAPFIFRATVQVAINIDDPRKICLVRMADGRARGRRPLKEIVDIVGHDQGVIPSGQPHQLFSSSQRHDLHRGVGESRGRVDDVFVDLPPRPWRLILLQAESVGRQGSINLHRQSSGENNTWDRTPAGGACSSIQHGLPYRLSVPFRNRPLLRFP